MATEPRRVARLLAVLPAICALAAPATVGAVEPWWEPLAFSGQRVTDVAVASPGVLLATTGLGRFISSDGGRSFQPLTRDVPPAGPGASAPSRWEINDGTVFSGAPGRPLTADPRAPYLGSSAHLIAAPAALPGVVVAVGSDDHVWRRNAAGHWATSFVLLPAGGLSGAPPVTSLAAFTKPLSGAVYMATDGYGVLLSNDGGDDWVRADPGLPASVLALATDPAARALFAATGRGLFVHHLQAFPTPPSYHDAGLYARWLGIAAVGLVAAVAAILGLTRVMPRAQ